MRSSLKPENILIDKDGYAKLCDFGLSKTVTTQDGRTKSFCGTAEYMLPEMLNKEKYTKAVDWWSYGCILYELVTGLPPFYTTDRDKLFFKIKSRSKISERIR